MAKNRKAVKAAVVAVLIFALGLSLGFYIQWIGQFQGQQEFEGLGSENVTVVSMKVPAVDQDGNGVATTLTVQAISGGSGKVLANVDKLLFWVDTQQSIQTAKDVAQNYTGKDLSNYDLVYTITTDASAIEGGSAGAALTVATIAALDRIPLRNDVMITGTIEEDGTIGPIGGVQEKADAAKASGMSIFLIPSGNVYSYKYTAQEVCEKIPGGRFCMLKSVPVAQTINSNGLTIEHVGNITEALSYFKV